LGRIGELNAFFVESTEDFLIDLLLYIHIDIIIWRGYIVDCLKIKREITERLEMGTITSDSWMTLDRFYDGSDDRRNFLNMFLGCFIGYPNSKDHSPSLHLFIVVDARCDKITIRHDE
jgi:hypothetical protein